MNSEDAKQAVSAAKAYVEALFADEGVAQLGLEEIEQDVGTGQWSVTLGFSRPWSTVRTRAQEVLEDLGALPAEKRSFKVVTLSPDFSVLSMRKRATADVLE